MPGSLTHLFPSHIRFNVFNAFKLAARLITSTQKILPHHSYPSFTSLASSTAANCFQDFDHGFPKHNIACSSVRFQLRNMSHIRKYLTRSTTECLVHSLISSRLISDSTSSTPSKLCRQTHYTHQKILPHNSYPSFTSLGFQYSSELFSSFDHGFPMST